MSMSINEQLASLRRDLDNIAKYLGVDPENLKPAPEPVDPLRQDLDRVVRIKSRVAFEFRIARHRMECKDRHRMFAWPRQVAMYLSWSLTDLGTTRVGYEFGGRDHGTVIHACKVVEARMGTHNETREHVLRLKAQLA